MILIYFTLLLGIFVCSSTLGVRYANEDLPTEEEIGPIAYLIYPTDKPYPIQEHLVRQACNALKELHRLDKEDHPNPPTTVKSTSRIAKASAHSKKIVPLVEALTPFLRTANTARAEGFLSFLNVTDNTTRCAISVRARSFFEPHMTISERAILLWFFTQMHRKKTAGLDQLIDWFSERESGQIPDELKRQLWRCAEWGYAETFSRTSKNRLESLEEFFTIFSRPPRKNLEGIVPFTIDVLNHCSPQNRFSFLNGLWEEYTIRPGMIRNIQDLAAKAVTQGIPLQGLLDLIFKQPWPTMRALAFLEYELSLPYLDSDRASRRLKALKITGLQQEEACRFQQCYDPEILDVLLILYPSQRDFSETRYVADELQSLLTYLRLRGRQNLENAFQQAAYATRDLTTPSMRAHEVQAIFRAFLNLGPPDEIVPRREAVIEQLTVDLLRHNLSEERRFYRIMQLIQDPLTPFRGPAFSVFGDRHSVQDQEAIWHTRQAIISDYRELKKHETAHKLIQTHVPPPTKAQEEYLRILESLDTSLTETLSHSLPPPEKFRLEKARNALSYFKERHNFQMYGHTDLPNLHQLFVLFYRLNTLKTPDLKPNLIYYLTQHFSEFQSIFPNLAGGYANAGHFFATPEGNLFVNELWKVYQGQSDTLPLPDHKISAHQARFLMRLPYWIVQPMKDELIQKDLEKRRSIVAPLFPTLLETRSPTFKGEEAFVRFMKGKLYLLEQGEALRDLTGPQMAYLRSLHTRLPQLFYLKGVADQLQAHQSKLNESMLTPIFEVLFMTVRAHCTALMDPYERDKLSCTDGTYLRLLQGIQETITLMLKEGNLHNTSAMLQLVRCS